MRVNKLKFEYILFFLCVHSAANNQLKCFLYIRFDNFEVYYGNNTELGQQFRISGGESGGFFLGEVFESMYNQMLITFITNNQITEKGFNISYSTGRLANQDFGPGFIRSVYAFLKYYILFS